MHTFFLSNLKFNSKKNINYFSIGFLSVFLPLKNLKNEKDFDNSHEKINKFQHDIE